MLKTGLFAYFGLLLAAAAPSLAADDAEAEQIASCRALEEIRANDPPEKVYSTFNRFCKANFGVRAEPLTLRKGEAGSRHSSPDELEHGRKLEGRTAQAVSVRESTTSACVAWMTELPATSYVEFGETPEFGRRTGTHERPFYVHVHHLTGLKPATRYRFRCVMIGEDGKESDTSFMFTTLASEKVVKFPGDTAGPPYVIAKPGHYVLTRDITAPRTAIEVTAGGVTLDLGGHTVTYGTEKLPKEHFTDKWMSYVRTGSFGVKNMGGSKFNLLNGRIVQGAGNNRGNDESCGFNPVYVRGCSDVEIAGVEVDYWTPQLAGVRIRNAGDNYDIHHNVIRDRGTKMHNRHGSGCSALDFIGTKGKNYRCRCNLVARTRQNGLRGRFETSDHNEIYVDSWATNSFATSVAKGGLLSHNRIFGTGYHAIACPWGDGIRVHDNFIHMQGINTGKTRWWEGFGDQNSMNGLRHTQWGNNKTPSTDSDYARNTVVIKGRNGAQIRGVEFFSDTYIKGLTLRDSTVKVISQDEKTTKAACVATHGNARREKTQNPVFYRNCAFISNVNMIRLGDDYGTGSHHHFIGCRFVREGKDTRFHTITAMGAYWSRYHRLIDCVFGEGAAPDDVDWTTTRGGTRNYTVEWTLTVKTAPGEEVVVTDAAGAEVYRGKADEAGKVSASLAQYMLSNAPERKALTPHTVRACGKSVKVTMDGKKKITVR